MWSTSSFPAAAFFVPPPPRGTLGARMLPAWLGLSAVARAAAPVKLILDTDMGGGACRDVDDVVALCTLHAMMDNGEVELLAVLQDTLPPPCAGAISVINHWYGRDEIPIGAYKGAGLSLVLWAKLKHIYQCCAP